MKRIMTLLGASRPDTHLENVISTWMMTKSITKYHGRGVRRGLAGGYVATSSEVLLL